MKTLIVLLHAAILLCALAALEGCASSDDRYSLGKMFNAKDLYDRQERIKY